MEKQYYDLIVSLIEAHPKYKGHESLLEEIANDVYNHSQVVFSSVSNEDVLTAYVNKVISNSLVTVSKKHNLNVRPRHTASSILSAIEATRAEQTAHRAELRTTEPTVVTVVEEDLEPESFVEPESQDKQENIIEQPEQEESVLELPIEEDLDIESKIEEESVSDTIKQIEEEEEEKEDSLAPEEDDFIEVTNETIPSETDNEPLENLIIEEVKQEVIEEISEEKVVTLETQQTLNEIKPDMTLVDKMINGVKNESDELDSEQELVIDTEDDFTSLEDLTVADEINEITEVDIVSVDIPKQEVQELEENLILESDILEEAEDIQPIMENEQDIVSFAKDVAEQVVADEFLGSPDENDAIQAVSDEELELIEEVLSEEEIIESNEDNSETLEFLTEIEDDNSVNSIEETEKLHIDEEDVDLTNTDAKEDFEQDTLIEELEPLEIEEPQLSLEESDSADISTLEELPEEDVVELESTDGIIEVQDSTKSANSIYSCFDYEPNFDNIIYNSDDILSILEEYNTKHPEHRVLEICELKYSKKISVSEIAQKLEFSENLVLEILNEVFDMVKD